MATVTSGRNKSVWSRSLYLLFWAYDCFRFIVYLYFCWNSNDLWNVILTTVCIRHEKWSSWSLIWEQDGTNVSFISHIHVRFLSCVSWSYWFVNIVSCRCRPQVFHCLVSLFKLNLKFAKTWTRFSSNVNTTIRKYWSRAFIWVVTPLGFVG